MNPEQWEKLKELHALAIELPAAERASFLDAECKGDGELRAELESLLAHAEPELLDERPVWAKLVLDAWPRRDLTGTDLSHYKIQSLIGVGGMGEVWLAKDQQLGRNVAIKILPTEFSADAERVRRFEREARAASALNHPNILTVHEIGRLDDVHFIVTEFVDGETLRQRLKAGPLTLAEALKIAVQISEALAAAHEIGIVHRDIKPENIMLRRDGYVKVLDFGIAKWIERRRHDAGPPEAERRAIAQPLRLGEITVTQQGKTPGTLGYMSPEQAAGLPVDVRTDVFSLGVMLHEMVSGQAPFAGATSLEAVQAILEREPPPLPPEVPAELAPIVHRALAKKRADRYQTARALQADLTQLQQQWAAPHAGTDHTEGRTLSVASPASPVANRLWLRQVAIGLLVLIALGFGAWRLAPLLNRHPPPEPEISLSKIVDGAGIGEAAISPDGQYVAYTLHEVKPPSVWVKQLATQKTVELVPPAAQAEYSAPTFAPDNRTLYFLRYDAQRDVKELYRVPVTGGTPQRVLEGIDSPVAVAPDGQQLAFIRFNRPQKESALVVRQLDGSNERQLVTRQEPSKLFVGRPAWSPDGNSIAYAVGTSKTTQDYQLYETPVTGGTERLLTTDRWPFVKQMIWLKDRRGLILLADTPRTFILHLSFPAGHKRRLTSEFVSELEDFHSLTMTADETALVTVRAESMHKVQVLSGNKLSQTVLLDSGKQEGHDGLGWMPDGRIVYASKKDGPPTIACIDAEGKNLRRLPFIGTEADAPSASADGRYLVYSAVNTQSSGQTTRNIWRMNADGSQPQQLTFGQNEIDPRCSPDNRWVVYAVYQDNGRRSLWKVPLTGGPAVPLTPESAANPNAAFAPDGKLLAYYHRGAENQHKRIHIVSVETGQLVQTLAIPHTAYLLQWINAGLCFAEIRQGVTNLWRLPLDGRPAAPMTDFRADVITQFAWSPDGTQLLCARRSQNDNVLLLRDFK